MTRQLAPRDEAFRSCAARSSATCRLCSSCASGWRSATIDTISALCKAAAEPAARWKARNPAAKAANGAMPAAVVAGDSVVRGVNRFADPRISKLS